MTKRLFVLLVLLMSLVLPVLAQDELPAADELEAGWNTLVPGGETTCSRDTEFKFFVRPAETETPSNNLMIYFQGGGACWNDMICSAGQFQMFDDSIGTAEEEVGIYNGIFDYTNELNPVTDYTAVFIPYCTADIHLGDAVIEYAGGNATVNHKGFVNASAVLDWVYENYTLPEQVFITGSSAGAYGAIFHAPYIINNYPDAAVVMLGDAGVGVAPKGWEVMEQWGMYNNMPQFNETLANIDPAEFYINTLYSANIEANPDAKFAQYTTTGDSVQIQFYGIIGGKTPWLEGADANLTELQAFENFRSFTAGGDTHTILASPYFYTYAVNGTTFRDWLAALLNGEDVENLRCEDCEAAEEVGGE